MANKSSSNLKSQEQIMKAAVQSQLARIKKEEEEELWISGEELYTEGSSDEEDCKTLSRSRRKVNSNRSSRASSANPSEERSGRSPIPSETKRKSDNVYKIDEGRSVSTDTPKSIKTSSTEKSSIESKRTQSSSATKLSARFITKDINSINLSNNEDQLENMEISWKAKRGEFCCNTLEIEDQYDIDVESIETSEWAESEISKMKDLENVVYEISSRLKKVSQETLVCQYENRRRLEYILSSCPTETGKLAENTRQFFQLCPKYMMLDAETIKTAAKVGNAEICMESNISRSVNEFNQDMFNNEDNANFSNLNNEPVDFEMFHSTEKEKERIMNLTNLIEDVNDETLDSDINPYTIDKEVMLEMEKETSVYCNNQEAFDSVSKSNTLTSIPDTISTIVTLRDIDKDLVNEVIKEAGIVNPSSILNVAEHGIDI